MLRGTCSHSSLSNQNQANDIAMCILRTMYAVRGYARHVVVLSSTQRVDAALISSITLALAVASHCSGRVSVALLMYKVQGPSVWRTRLLFFIIGTIAATGSMVILTTFLWCSPSEAVWNTALVTSGQAHCISEADYAHIDQGAAGLQRLLVNSVS